MELKIILNSIVTDAVISKQRLRNPNSNKIGDFVNEWMKNNLCNDTYKSSDCGCLIRENLNPDFIKIIDEIDNRHNK